MNEMDQVKRMADAMDIAFGLIEPEPKCDRCGAPGEFRGGRCYGCIQLTQELERIRIEVRAVRRALAPGMEEHIKPILLGVEESLKKLEEGKA